MATSTLSTGPSPFQVTVYDKTFTKQGMVPAPKQLSVTLRHNQMSEAEIVVASGSPRLGALLATDQGPRVVITFNGAHLLSGDVVGWKITGRQRDYVFTIHDDWRLFERILAWPVPTAALTAQTLEYDLRTGPAETVLKALVSVNKGRHTPVVTVAANLGRGGTISTKARFDPLVDVVVPFLDAAGIGATVRQATTGASSGTLVLDVYEQRTHPRTLTIASGVVVDPEVTFAVPTATRVIIGGAGSGAAQRLSSLVNTGNETKLGWSSEAFVSASGTDDNDTTGATQRLTQGQQYLAESITRTGLSVTLRQIGIFRYDPTGANGVRVGDLVPVEVAPGIVVTDLIRSCTLTHTVAAGVVIAPQIGDRTNDTYAPLTQAVGDIARSLRGVIRRIR